MDPAYISHILRMILASAICTAMIGFGLLSRRRDGSRRGLFLNGGLVCSALTILTILTNSEGAADVREATIQIIVGAGLIFPAVPMFWMGKRGRRVGDHPICRTCGFDLFGKPPQSTRCGECGADLQLPRATVIGIRKMRVGWMLGAIFLLCLGLLLAARPAYEYAGTFDFYQFKPISWVLTDMKSPDLNVQKKAGEFIAARLQDPNLTESQAKVIADYLLNRPSNGWTWRFLPLLVQAVDQRDILDEAMTRQLMRRMAGVDGLGVHQVLLLGRPISLWSCVPPLSAQNPEGYQFPWGAHQKRLVCKVTAETIRVGDVMLPPGAATLVIDSHGGRDFQLDPGADWVKLSLGPVKISRDITLRITLPYKGKQLVETVQYSRTARSQFVTPENATPPLAAPSANDQSMKWTATLTAIEQAPQLQIARNAWGSRVFARVVIITAQGRSDAGTIELASGQNVSVVQSSSPLKPPDGDFQLELTPAPVDAINELDMTPVLNQVIRIRTVQRMGDSEP